MKSISNIEFQQQKKNNPWSKPINSITWGFILTVMAFDFFNLKYILSTIGVGLLYIGFYDLRKENKELKNAWIFSIINLAVHAFGLIHVNTPLNVILKNNFIMVFILTVFQVSFLFIFRKGINKVFEENGVKPSKDPLLRIIIWRVFIVIFSIKNLGSVWFIAIPVIILYFYNFYLLSELREELASVEFKNLDESKDFKSKKHVLGYTIGCIILVIICNLGFNHIRLDSTKFVSAKFSKYGDKLINMGFPKTILKDMEDKDINMLKDAIHIDVSSETLMFDCTEENAKDQYGGFKTIKKAGENNLKATFVYVELKDKRMYGIEYFQWIKGNPYWHDGVIISGSETVDLISGKLLYEKDGTNYLAAIPRLKNEMISETDWFGIENDYKKITGAVNYPFGSSKQRGYAFYQIRIRKEAWRGKNIFNYIHYTNPFRTSYEETERKNSMFSDKKRQHTTMFKTKACREHEEEN